MVVEIRIYRRFDSDLIAMYHSGYDLAKMFEATVMAYAHGQALRYRLDPERIPVAFPETKTLHFRVMFTDDEATKVLKGIRFGFRNAFCKMLLREALVAIPLSQYFAEPFYLECEKDRIREGHRTDDGASVLPCPIKEPRQYGFKKKAPLLDTGEPTPDADIVEHAVQAGDGIKPGYDDDIENREDREADLMSALESMIEDGSLPYTP